MMTDRFINWAWQGFFLSGVSLLVCWVSVRLAPVYPWLAGRRSNLTAVQAAHTRLTPRVAGVGIFVSLGLGAIFTPDVFVSEYVILLSFVALLFFAGLFEDLGLGVSPGLRLIISIIASLGVIYSLDVWLMRADMGWIDPYMVYWPVGVFVTALATAGVTNGFNLIDGVNGLAALVSIACALALAAIAYQVGFYSMVKLNFLLFSAILGFVLMNYPLGKIFLGDAGAYTIGFVLSWFCVLLIVRHPEVSPLAVLLTVFWPVADTLLAIYRRLMRKANTTLPDRLHVHQLVMRALEIYWLGRGHRNLANPLTTLVLAPFVIAPPVTAVFVWHSTFASQWAVVAFVAAFFAAYVLAFPLLHRLPRRHGCRKD